MAQSLRDWDVQTESKICGTEVRAGAAVHEAPSRMALEGSPRSARQSLSRICILTRAGLLNARDPPTPPLLQVS